MTDPNNLTLDKLTEMLDSLPKMPRMSRYYACNRATYDYLIARLELSPDSPSTSFLASPFWGVNIIVDPYILTDGEFRDDQGRVVTS